MKGAVHIVFSRWVSGGLRVFAVCSSRKAAEMARGRVAEGKKRDSVTKRVWFYDRPLGDPYACEICIVKVQVDVLYPRGLDEAKLNEFAGNSNEKEIIR